MSSVTGAGPDAVTSGERTVFRLPGAIVAWWAWVAVAVAGLADLLATGRDHTSAEIVAVLALVTGLVYACTLWPRIIAGPTGLAVRNPLREHWVPWGSVTGIDLRESVQVHHADGTGGKPEKIIYSWALYAPRRTRLRADRAGRPRGVLASRAPSYGRMPDEAKELLRQPAVKVMAAQLNTMAADARERGAAAGPRVVRWSWQPTVAIVVPAAALALVSVLR